MRQSIHKLSYLTTICKTLLRNIIYFAFTRVWQDIQESLLSKLRWLFHFRCLIHSHAQVSNEEVDSRRQPLNIYNMEIFKLEVAINKKSSQKELKQKSVFEGDESPWKWLQDAYQKIQKQK